MAGSNPDRGKTVSTVLGRRLGSELLRMRLRCNLGQAAAAKALTASVTKVAKMERGLVPMRDPDIRALCHLYGEGDEGAIDLLLELAEADRNRRKAKGWWDHYTDLRSLVELVALEDIATHIRSWEVAVLPGILQTPDYARALAVGSGAWSDPEKIEPFVEARMARKARLLGEQSFELWVVLHEGVLRQLVGGHTVMKDQLGHLLDMAKRPNVKVQVVPYSVGAHPTMGIAFSILSFAEAGALDVVHMDTASSGVWLEGETDAKRHGQLFAHLAQMGLSEQDSVALINGIVEEL
ncbi:DUF5753 domain-containing protein [Streptomyces sp. NPDC101062]|uniref:DUF5753 domain-containing protein n=1 Tax=unclassified Streptomyces TaxID=2593676 RepID=UPI002E77F08F|nr:DUF5753 domain-containing protein [Streptomyces sp. JV176]MEE1802874.1 DUF5753 domain-containing protein [Streptomyces sp. JV176]